MVILGVFILIGIEIECFFFNSKFLYNNYTKYSVLGYKNLFCQVLLSGNNFWVGTRINLLTLRRQIFQKLNQSRVVNFAQVKLNIIVNFSTEKYFSIFLQYYSKKYFS